MRQTFLANLTDTEATVLLHDWEFWKRPSQCEPDGAWYVWLLLGGRGMGKTRVGAQWTIKQAETPGTRIALVAKDPADARDVMLEGESGVLACSPPWFRPRFEPSKRRVTWPNGSQATLYSAEVPDDLRGPQHHKAWGDEICKWKHPQDTWDNLIMGLRLGDNPQAVITTTPRPIPTLRMILADPTTRITRGSTFENAANLPQKFLDELKRKYEGTRLGRQELYAELLTDTPGALWTQAQIEALRVKGAPTLKQIAVAIDPAVTATDDSDETGIVAGGVGEDGHGYVLADESGRMSPGAWGERAVMLFDRLQANNIVAEANNGGDMVGHVLRSAAKSLYDQKKRPATHVPFKLVHASRGKLTRAEPVAALYEQRKIHHVGMFAQLEDQMATWTVGNTSPDRMDALVWCLTALLATGEDGPMQRIRLSGF